MVEIQVQYDAYNRHSAFSMEPRREFTVQFLPAGLMEDSEHLECVAIMATPVLAALTK
jgi:hypothetical protein